MFLITQLIRPPVFQAVETPCTCMHVWIQAYGSSVVAEHEGHMQQDGAGLQHAHHHVAANSLSDSSTVAAVVSATCPAPNCTYSCIVGIIRAQIQSIELIGPMYRMHALATSSHNRKAKMHSVKALIADVMHVATWSVDCTGSTGAGGTVHSKECPELFAILMYLLRFGLSSLLAVYVSAMA